MKERKRGRHPRSAKRRRFSLRAGKIFPTLAESLGLCHHDVYVVVIYTEASLEGSTDAHRTARTAASRRRNRLRGDGSKDSHRRNRGTSEAEVGPDAKRASGRKGARKQAIARGPQKDRKKGGRGSVELMAAPNLTRKPFLVDKEKVLEAILYLMNKANNLSQYDIVKTIFFADRSHLNKYGRPVTFDNYVAMEHGPVPSFAYDILKPDTDFSRFYAEERPWVSVQDRKINRFTKAKRKHNADVLSETDTAALDSALDIIQTLSFSQIKRLTHEDPAYIEAWGRRGVSDAADMDMQRLLEDEQDNETIERLAYSSQL